MKMTLITFVVGLGLAFLFPQNADFEGIAFPSDGEIDFVDDSIIFAYSLEEAMENPDKVVGLMIEDYDYFPEEIFKLHRLRSLFLGSCTFPEFPQQIDQLIHLTSITFASSFFIPKGISQIQNLTSIELAGFVSGDPPIHTFQISDEVSKCPNLKNIQVKICDPVGLEKFGNIENAFLYMVDSAAAFSGICQWKNLKRLNVADIRAQKLPNCLSELPQLEKLEVHFNNLEELPENIGAFVALKELIVVKTQLGKLPEALFSHSSLQKIVLKDNKLSLDEVQRLKVDTIIFEQKPLKWSFP